MKWIIAVLLLGVLFELIVAPPVQENKKEDKEEGNGLEDVMEYHRYLQEVVNALESDPEFKKKLEKADENDIKSGKIAEELEFVSHNVRSKLDEVKRVELERLKQLTEKKRKLMEDVQDDDPMHHHLDHKNPHTFEIEDLKKLIAKTTQDLAEADRKRQEEFKQYEMEKEFEKFEKLNKTNGEEKEKLEKQYKEMEEKHKKHEKLHEPGHKAQLEEVWEKQDQMDQDFDPKTFFMLHDLDSNGLWDQEEVKALFVKELDKMYQQDTTKSSNRAPEDDMRERVEEMERMRESVFREMDRNRDGFIDYNEFLAQTKTNEFNQDHGWQGLDEQKPYTDEELQEYIRQHHAQMMQQGYGYNPNYPPPGYGGHPAGYGQPQGYPGGQQYHPNAIPQQQYHPNAVPQQQYHQNAVPQQQYHPNTAQQQQYHPNAVPQQQYHPNAAPQQQYQQGAVPQQQFHPGQVPQAPPQQLHPQQGVQQQQQQQQTAPPQRVAQQAVPQQNTQQVHQQNQAPQQNQQRQPQGGPQGGMQQQGYQQAQQNQYQQQVPQMNNVQSNQQNPQANMV